MVGVTTHGSKASKEMVPDQRAIDYHGEGVGLWMNSPL
jgi:hypothetical protein